MISIFTHQIGKMALYSPTKNWRIHPPAPTCPSGWGILSPNQTFPKKNPGCAHICDLSGVVHIGGRPEKVSGLINFLFCDCHFKNDRYSLLAEQNL